MNAAHIILVGQTGAGKTSLARMLASIAPRLIVMDSSNDPIWESTGTTFFDAQKAANFFLDNLHNDFQITLRLDSRANYLTYIDMVYDIQNNTPEIPPVLLLMEEAGIFSSSHTIPPQLENAIARGRRAKLSILSIAQRETQISPTLRSQGMVSVSLRQANIPQTTREDFDRDTLSQIPTLKTLTPFTPPKYGIHYVTAPANVDPFALLAKAMLDPGEQGLPEDYTPPI